MLDRKNIPSDIQIVIGLVILTIIFITVPQLSDSIISTMLGLPMVLFLPGYALIAALFPRQDDLDGIERLALSFGLSIAVVPLIGLGLNYTPWGIRLVPILVSLSIFIIVMCIIAVLRRSDLPENEAFNVPFKQAYLSLQDEIKKEKTEGSKLDRALTIILVISILASVVTLAYVIATPKTGERFTEFYILGPEGMADNYPVNYTLGESGEVIIGVVNHEYRTVNYSIDIRLENESIDYLADVQNIQLDHNETWKQPVTITPHITGENMKLQFLLFKDHNYTGSYRDLHLWIDVSEGENNL